MPGPGGGYLATLGPDAVEHDQLRPVVIATGTFGRTPWVPAEAGRSRSRHRAAALQRVPAAVPAAPGRCWWSGPRTPGMDVAYEAALTHETILCGRDRGELAVRLESRARPDRVLPLHALDLQARAQPPDPDGPQGDGSRALPRRPESAGQAGRPGRPRGGTDQARFAGVAGRPADAGRRPACVDAANMVWCTGFQQRFDWVKLPIFDGRGWPGEYRGVVEGAPGSVLLRPELPVRVQLDDLARRRAGTPRTSPTQIVASPARRYATPGGLSVDA